MKHKIKIAIKRISVMLLLSFAGGATAQSSGPIAWWPGDGNANDVVGPNHGTLHNGVGFVPGQVGQAFSFDGVNDFVSFGNSIGNFGTGDFTVEFWIRTSAVREEVVLGKRSSCSASSMWDSAGHAPGGPNAAQLTMAVSESPGLINHIRIFGDEWTDGTFHHFAYTRQGTTLRGYRDGVKEAETITSAVANMSNSAELRASFSPCIGRDARKHLTGELDEIKLYDRALSAAEIAAAAGLGPTLACVGFEPPMDGGAVTVKKNRALPHKGQLLDENSQPINDLDIAAAPVIQVIFDDGVLPAEDVSDDALSAGAGTDGNQFEFLGSVWQFNLKTRNYTAAGTYTTTMESGDEAEYLIDPTCEAAFVIN